MAAISRRRIAALGTGAGLLAALGALSTKAQAKEPDAELIALCTEFCRLEASLAPYKGRDDEIMDAAVERVGATQKPLVDAICATRATTLAGMMAKASVVGAYAPDWLDPFPPSTDRRLLASLLSDMTGRPPATVPVRISDPELLAQAQAFLVEDDLIQKWNNDQVSEDEGEAANRRWWRALRAIEPIPATTLAGLIVKADVAVKAWDGADGPHCDADGLAHTTLMELAAWRARA